MSEAIDLVISAADVVLTAAGTIPTVSGSGDMLAATYDPQTIEADVFDVDNHTDGTTNKVYTAVEQSKLSGIEAGADVTDATNVDAAGATMNADTSLTGNGYFLDEDNMSSNDATKVASQQSIKAYADAIYTQGTGSLTDGASVAWDCGSKKDNRYFLSTAQSTIALTLSNVSDYSVNNLMVKKTIAGDCAITLGGTGLTFRGPDDAGYASSAVVTLTGAANDRFELSLANYGPNDVESTNKCLTVSKLIKIN